jgi:putative transposase
LVSQRRVCGLIEIAESSYRYRSRRNDEALRGRLVEAARAKPRWGYRRLQIVLERSGERVNHKRVYRVYREAGLMIRRRARKRLLRAGAPRPVLTAPNQEWALDFVQDAAESGRKFRALSVVDPYTRECLALEVDTSMGSRRATRVLEGIIAERGVPQAIRSDNGPEFTSRHFLAWCLEKKIELVHIEPGKPVQNAHVESFHGKLRDECLNASWFANLFEARRKIAAWREEYNQERPHSSLGYRTPAEFAAAAKGCGKDGGFATLENAARFPLSHSHGDLSLSGEMFKQQNLLGSEESVV